MTWLVLALVFSAEPQPAPHTHCFHAPAPGTRVVLEPTCCWCGVPKGCVGHGPFKPGCAPANTSTIPGFLPEPSDLRYDYDRGY